MLRPEQVPDGSSPRLLEGEDAPCGRVDERTDTPVRATRAVEPSDEISNVGTFDAKRHDPQRQIGRVVNRRVAKIRSRRTDRVTPGCV
jgi:hypothetical protein